MRVRGNEVGAYLVRLSAHQNQSTSSVQPAQRLPAMRGCSRMLRLRWVPVPWNQSAAGVRILFRRGMRQIRSSDATRSLLVVQKASGNVSAAVVSVARWWFGRKLLES